MEKSNTHIVLKKEDVLRYLEESERKVLENMIYKIMRGRDADGKKGFNSYYVVNEDEPYAEIVHNVILGGEALKRTLD